MRLKLLFIIFVFLFLPTNFIWAKDCQVGEVIWEGGAVACPTCETAAENYPYNPEFGDVVNGHIKNALNDDLASAKWLMEYFSQEKTKNYEEAKKWFGRALGINSGKNAEAIPLKGGYDEPYLVSANLIIDSSFIIKLISSCDSVNNMWQPLCYHQNLEAILKDDIFKSISKSSNATITNTNFRNYQIVISKIYIYEFNNNFLIITETNNLLEKKEPRSDYYLIDFDKLKKELFESDKYLKIQYLGSNWLDNNIYLQNFHPESPTASLITAKKQFKVLEKQKDIINEFIANGNCLEFNVKPYPTK